MIRQIVIEAELPDDAQSMFRLSINANLIANGVTAQAHYLVGEVLGRIGSPERAETVMSDADGNARRAWAYPGRRLRLWEPDGAVVPTNASGHKSGAKR